jgi:hypothetical protein
LAPFLDADWLLLPFLGNKASSVAILSNPQLKAQNRGFISALEGCWRSLGLKGWGICLHFLLYLQMVHQALKWYSLLGPTR